MTDGVDIKNYLDIMLDKSIFFFNHEQKEKLEEHMLKSGFSFETILNDQLLSEYRSKYLIDDFTKRCTVATAPEALLETTILSIEKQYLFQSTDGFKERDTYMAFKPEVIGFYCNRQGNIVTFHHVLPFLMSAYLTQRPKYIQAFACKFAEGHATCNLYNHLISLRTASNQVVLPNAYNDMQQPSDNNNEAVPTKNYFSLSPAFHGAPTKRTEFMKALINGEFIPSDTDRKAFNRIFFIPNEISNQPQQKDLVPIQWISTPTYLSHLLKVLKREKIVSDLNVHEIAAACFTDSNGKEIDSKKLSGLKPPQHESTTKKLKSAINAIRLIS